jgi:hypothetical protein
VSCGLRDVLEFERQGKPAALVASSAFEETAAKQAAALGQPAARRAFVPHPVQDRTDGELREMARSVADELLDTLSGAQR